MILLTLAKLLKPRVLRHKMSNNSSVQKILNDIIIRQKTKHIFKLFHRVIQSLANTPTSYIFKCLQEIIFW